MFWQNPLVKANRRQLFANSHTMTSLAEKYRSKACPPCPTSASLGQKAIYWLGIGLGSGLPQKAPGTWGTLGGLILGLGILAWGSWVFTLLVLVGGIFGSSICGITSKLMGGHDNPHIVFDEWVGMWLALLPVAYALAGKHFAFGGSKFWLLASTAFALFRFFDIIKPFPIGWADKKIGGGAGILLDDVLAGIMAAAVLVGAMAVFGNLP